MEIMHQTWPTVPNIFDSYCRDIKKSKPLSREQEAELAARIREGDIQARNELVQANLRFVVDVAKQYQDCGPCLS